jgi:nuclear pore complex protein Nup107
LRHLNLLKEEESLNKSDDIISIYVHELILKSHIRLVALYCKYILNEEKRISCYVKLMNGIQDRQDREACIELAFKYFPSEDVEVITRLVVENIRMLQPNSGGGAAAGSQQNRLALTTNTAATGSDNSSLNYFVSPKQSKKSKLNNSTPLSVQQQQQAIVLLNDHFQPVLSKLSNEDVTKIKSIEWLCIHNEHKAEAVAQANELLREFFNASSNSNSLSSLVGGGSSGTTTWRMDAAELLVQSNRGINDTTPPPAFPTQVREREESCRY